MTRNKKIVQHSFLGLVLGLVVLGSLGAGESLACILTNITASSPCTADTGGWNCPAGTELNFTTYLSAACPIDETIWRVSNLDSGQSDDYTYNVWQPEFTHTFSEGGAYTVKAIVYPTSNPPSSKITTVTVPETLFTVNILPSAGCTVLAGDGGVDDPEAEGNGIVCSGDTAADDPLCTEQYANSQIASLKVVPEPGHIFTGWTVNGGQVQSAATPLFLTTMPVLAQNGDVVTFFTGNIADCQANCSSVTISTPSSVQRDEIFDVTLTLDPPPLWGGMAVTFDLDGQKTQDLPERGTVQMYDFGYDIDGDGDIDPGQTGYVFNPLFDGGTKTIKAVHNVYLPQTPPYSIKVLATVGGSTFESQPIVMVNRVRQYTTTYGNTSVNGYDNFITQWIDYWAHWHYPDEESPYTFKMDGDEVDDALEYDLVKAICYKESTMGQVNLMQVFDPAINALEGPENERDWNWNAQPVATDPEKGSLYDMGDASPFMDYNAVAVSSHSESIKWGVRYLYSIKSKASYDYYAGCQDCSGKMYNPQWLSWDVTIDEYNSKKDPNNESYLPDVNGLYEYGRNPHTTSTGEREPLYMWPIMTRGSSRD